MIDEFRYNYKLTANDLVLDCGFFRGDFSRNILDLFGCKIIAFEPCKAFFDAGKERFKDEPRLELLPCGIGASAREETFHIQGDSTGLFAHADDIETVQIISFLDFLKTRNIKKVDLLKLNVEGMEYELLEQIIELGCFDLFPRIQVQFHHTVPGYVARYEAVRKELLKHYNLTFEITFVWEFYDKKS